MTTASAPKKLHRFFIESLPPESDFAIADKQLAHQITRVLGMTAGESFILFSNGSDDMVVEITSHGREELQVRTVRTVPQLSSPRMELIAAISIPKRDVFETVVQKLTELGVTQIVPIISGRTIKQSVRIDRLQAISNEAVEQCGGNRRIVIREPMELAACLAEFQLPAVLFDMSGSPLEAWNAGAHDQSRSCIMYIGPEGGWSDGDRAQFAAANAFAATLGPRTFRTDTAAIIGAYTILNLFPWN